MLALLLTIEERSDGKRSSHIILIHKKMEYFCNNIKKNKYKMAYKIDVLYATCPRFSTIIQKSSVIIKYWEWNVFIHCTVLVRKWIHCFFPFWSIIDTHNQVGWQQNNIHTAKHFYKEKQHLVCFQHSFVQRFRDNCCICYHWHIYLLRSVVLLFTACGHITRLIATVTISLTSVSVCRIRTSWGTI